MVKPVPELSKEDAIQEVITASLSRIANPTYVARGTKLAEAGLPLRGARNFRDFEREKR